MAVFKPRNCARCYADFTPDHPSRKYCKSCSASNKDWYVWSPDTPKRLTRLMRMAAHRAKRSNLPFDLDSEHLLKLWDASKGCCVLTGRKFDLAAWGEKGRVNPDAPSIDRIIPKLGYVKGNVRLITYHMNISLSDFGEDIFKILAESYLSGRV